MSSLERTIRRQMHRNKKAGYFKHKEPRFNDPELSRNEVEEFLNKLEDDKRKRQEKLKREGAPLVWAKMIYRCEDCGALYEMYLEHTLERHNGKDHKPVPFMIQCRACGGFHCFDRSLLIELPEMRYLEPDECYFKDDNKHDCGVPVIR